MTGMCYFGNGLSEYCRICYKIACNEYVLLVFAVGLWHVGVADKELTQEYYSQNNSHNTQWVCYGATQRRAATVYSQLFE